MIKTSINLQDLRRRIYIKAKADSVGHGGVGTGSITAWASMALTVSGTGALRKHAQPDRSHNPWCEANRKAECGKSARSV